MQSPVHFTICFQSADWLFRDSGIEIFHFSLCCTGSDLSDASVDLSRVVSPCALVGRRLKDRFITSLETLVRYLVLYFLQGKFSWIVLLRDDHLPCCKDVEDIFNVSLYHVLLVCKLSFI
jgi:hypothetical protein